MDSPWHPYIESLPLRLPCLLCDYTYEDITAIEYGDIRSAIDSYVWLVSDAWQRLRPEAHGNSSREEFDWAMTMVHSRSFGTAGNRGPQDIHMLMPLADMFNHGGDICGGLFKEPFRKRDGAEWSLLPPEDASSSEWHMQFVASTDISPNEQVIP